MTLGEPWDVDVAAVQVACGRGAANAGVRRGVRAGAADGVHLLRPRAPIGQRAAGAAATTAAEDLGRGGGGESRGGGQAEAEARRRHDEGLAGWARRLRGLRRRVRGRHARRIGRDVSLMLFFIKKN